MYFYLYKHTNSAVYCRIELLLWFEDDHIFTDSLDRNYWPTVYSHFNDKTLAFCYFKNSREAGYTVNQLMTRMLQRFLPKDKTSLSEDLQNTLKFCCLSKSPFLTFMLKKFGESISHILGEGRRYFLTGSLVVGSCQKVI